MTENQEGTSVIVVVESHSMDDFGNMNVTAKDGSTHKINKKHSVYHDMIQDGTAYTFNYRIFVKDGRKIPYVYSVEPMASQIADLPSVEAAPLPPGPNPVPREISGVERGMWGNCLNALICSGRLEECFPKQHEAVLAFHLAAMCNGIGYKLYTEE